MWGKRWSMLVAGLWIQFTAGSPYVFGLYSESLKRALGYSQTQLDTIALFKGIGANVGVHAGLLYLVLPPWGILLAGSLLELCGYLLIWLAATHRVPGMEFWQVCFFMLVAANAQTFVNTAVVVTSVTNFPASRGTVVGLMKGGLGLSGALLTLIFRALHFKDEISYILFAAVVPAMVTLLLSFLVRQMPVMAPDPLEMTNLYRISGIILALAVLLIPISIVSLVNPWDIAVSILLLLLLASPLLVAWRAELRSDQAQQEQARLLDEDGNLEDSKKPIRSRKPAGRESTLAEAFTSLEFWLLFIAMFCGLGTGLTTIDNVNQLGLSLGYSQRDISVVVSLISIANFLGRFLAGFVSDKLLHSRGFPRPAFIAVALGLAALGHLIVAAALPGALYVGCLVIVLGYGAHWSLMPATVSEIFGLRQFGTLFNSVTVANPLGSYVFSVCVAGFFYDREARRQGSESLSCSGAHCFRVTFLILAGVCVLGCLSTIVLVFRTKRYYSRTLNFETYRTWKTRHLDF